MDVYLVKWKGKQSGPFSLAELRSKLSAREISHLHEVQVAGQWMTVRNFFKSLEEKQVVEETPEEPVSLRGTMEPIRREAQVARPKPAPAFEEIDTALVDASAGRGEEVVEKLRSQRERYVLVHAGFWIRALAMAFDAIIIGLVPAFLVGLVLGLDVGAASAGNLEGIVGGNVFLLLLQWVYFAGMESSQWQATLGKLMTGLIVTDERGKKISFQRASGRHFAKILSGLMLLAGFFLAAFTRKKQAFHDLLSDCTVNFLFPEDRILEG